jgi:large subunit ribosomal protein L25
MQSITLDVQPRETGKKATKAVRNAGLVPCVLYGSHTEPVHFAVETLALRPLIYTTETYRVQLAVDGGEHEAIVKEVVFHPITDQPIHADFQALTAGEALTMVVPVHLEGAPVGVKAGGILSQTLSELEIRALPKDIPGHISIDVSSLQVGESIHVEEIALGDSVEVLTDTSRTVATVTAPRIAVEEDEEAGEALDAPLGEAEGEGPAEDAGDEA